MISAYLLMASRATFNRASAASSNHSTLALVVFLIVLAVSVLLAVLIPMKRSPRRRPLDARLRRDLFSEVEQALSDPILVNQARRRVKAIRRG
jgi:hypothetical protein